MIAPTVRPIQFEDFSGTESERLEFRFNAIPVHLVSSIYQQFARTSAADKARSQGLRDMRVELVHLTLDLVFEGLSPNVVDAARGSGPSHRGFLATGLARYQWQIRPPGTRRSVLPALGVHINCGALGIAVFCL